MTGDILVLLICWEAWRQVGALGEALRLDQLLITLHADIRVIQLIILLFNHLIIQYVILCSLCLQLSLSNICLHALQSVLLDFIGLFISLCFSKLFHQLLFGLFFYLLTLSLYQVTVGEWKEVHSVTRFGSCIAEIFLELCFILFEFIIDCYKFQFLQQLVSCFIVLVLSHLSSIFLHEPPLLEDVVNLIIQVLLVSLFDLVDYLVIDCLSSVISESGLFAEAFAHSSFNESVQMRVLVCFFWVFHLFFDIFMLTLSFGNDQGSSSFAGVVSVLS